jgi:cobalamin biosynthesis protein CbiD
MQYHEDDIFAYVAKELLVAVDDETVISGNSTSNNTQEATSSTQGSNSSNTKRTDLFNKVKHAHRLLWLVALVAMTLALQAWLIHIVAQGGLTKLQLDDGVYDARDELQKARSKIPIAADLAAAKWPKQLQDSLKRLNSTAKCGEYPTKQQLKNVSNALSNEENVMMMKEMNEPPSNNITNIGNRTERQRNLVVDHVMREKQLKSLNTAVDLFSKSVKSANNYN